MGSGLVSPECSECMLINGRYQILHPLQEGGFGHTYLAEDTQLPSRRRCVIKQLKPIQNNPEFYKLIQDRFQREAAIQETLGEVCQQIPSLYAYFSENDGFYLVEEWVDGDTLRQRMAAVGKFSEAAVRELLNELLPTIETVHQYQIIHRDIKPDNIILRKRDGKPVLIDFGAVKESMATVINSQGQTARSIVIGTAGYMAPEQSAGRPVYSSDLYSLGLTAVYLLTGKIPAELNTDPLSGRMDWRSQAPHVSNAFAQVIDTAIHMHPGERFASAAAMYQALQTPAPSGPGYETTVISKPQMEATPAIQIPAKAPIQTPIQVPIRIPTQGSAGLPTQVVSPAHDAAKAQPTILPAKNEWLKPLLMGGGIGSVLLVGLILVRGQPLAPVVTDPSPASVPSVTTSPTASASATEPRPDSSPSEAPITADATCGDSNDKGQDWYPVFINNADVKDVRRKYCQDAIAKTRDDGTPTVQVASFTDRDRAVTFAQKVGGDVGLPYKMGTTPSPSSSPSFSPSPSPSPSSSPSPSPSPTDSTNAVIVGNKGETNIRSGPGTNFGVQHIAFPGDRVKILASDQDNGGYIWYKIYFPKSGASGWIAGQLLQPDS
jgi:serine/threonine protein kinase, bacterial